MAIRSRQIQPDQLYETVHGEQFAIVSREAIESALADGAAMLDIAGGTLSIVTMRAETGIPNERVTIAAMMEWKDRTDAKPQPESTVAPAVQPSTGEHEFTPEEEEHVRQAIAAIEAAGGELTDAELAQHFPDGEPELPVATDDNPDGFDFTTLEDEDVSDIPVEAR